MWQGYGSDDDRADEHAEGYNRFAVLQNVVVWGDVAEFGAGPFTQFRFISKYVNTPSVPTSVVLLEPNGEMYVNTVRLCSYKTGRLADKYPVTVVSLPGEGWMFVEQFDTVISINVLEHVIDAYDYLSNLFFALRPGGTIIFHERWHDDPIRNSGFLGGFNLHPIRVSRDILQHFINQFETLYLSTEPTSRMRSYHMTERKLSDGGASLRELAGETAFYFIGRKPLASRSDRCVR